MARGKLKFDWSVYSARRKVTLKLLMSKGLVRDYESYVAYCDEMSVIPMTRSSYDAEAALVAPPPAPPPTRLSPTEGPASEEPGLVATVWFAGVKDEAPPVSEAPIVTPASSKKKKQKETPPESKE